MEDIKPLLNIYSSKLFQLFCRIIQPLECLSLNGFCYSVTTTDGHYCSIGNNAKASELYCSNRSFIRNPFTSHPDNFQHNQSFITKDFPSQSYQDLLDPLKKTFGVDNYLILFKKEKDLAHILTFTSSNPNIPLNSIFINNHATLSAFGDYFLEEWRPHFSKMDPHMINLATDKGEQFYKPSQLMHLKTEKAQRMKLLRKIGLISEFDMCPSQLSRREKDLVEHYLTGKSASQIGLALGLSTRTVEHYIDNIKSKLGCNSKQELFMILQVYKHHNLY